MRTKIFELEDAITKQEIEFKEQTIHFDEEIREKERKFYSGKKILKETLKKCLNLKNKNFIVKFQNLKE